jgi:hypothetical protein
MIPKNCTVEVPTEAYENYTSTWPNTHTFNKYITVEGEMPSM